MHPKAHDRFEIPRAKGLDQQPLDYIQNVPEELVVSKKKELDKAGVQLPTVSPDQTLDGHIVLFGIPDQEAGEMHYEVSVPHLSSVIFGLGWNGGMEGLDVVPDEQEPPVAVVFWSFRVMVGLGFLMVGAGLWGLWTKEVLVAN